MKFIELPIFLFDKKMEEIGIDADEQVASMMVNPSEIAAFRQSGDGSEKDGELTLHRTCIYLKGGESFIIGIEYERFKKLLNEKS